MFRRGVSLPRFFIVSRGKNPPLQNAIRQRIEKYFEKSCKKICKECLIIYIFASLNIIKQCNNDNIRICKGGARSPFDSPKMD